MKNHGWSIHTIIRYTLLQIPGLLAFILIIVLIGRFVDISMGLSWGLVIIWVLKDIVLFPMVWRAYESGRRSKDDPIVGLNGIAVDRLAPQGYVRVRGELWKAELVNHDAVVEKGENVNVEGINGLILIVTRVES